MISSLLVIVCAFHRHVGAAGDQHYDAFVIDRATRQAADIARPAHRMHHALAYEPASRRVLLYGGNHVAGPGVSTLLDDLWSWDGRRWTPLAAHTGIAMSGHRLFADGRGGVFIVGGASGLTAQWSGQRWITVAADSTRRRAGAADAYDTRRNRYVLYGGSTSPRVIPGDTWEFDGERWIQVATNGPPRVHGASMAYDERRGVAVLFGGRDSSQRAYGETWTWNGRTWERRATNGPAPRAFAGMAYDSRNGEVVLFGGVDTSRQQLDDTWLWNGRAWRRAEVDGPPPRSEPFMAFDASRAVAVMFGGASASPHTLGDTWEWNGDRWRRMDPPDTTTRTAPGSAEFAALIRRRGIAVALRRFHDARRSDPDAALFRENTIRRIALQFLRTQPGHSVELLRISVALHAQSAEAHLALSEAYEAVGDSVRGVQSARDAIGALQTDVMDRGRQLRIDDAANDRIRRLSQTGPR